MITPKSNWEAIVLPHSPDKYHVRFASFNPDGFSLRTLYETHDPTSTLAKICTAILTDTTLSDNAKHALIELMRVAYEEVSGEQSSQGIC